MSTDRRLLLPLQTGDSSVAELRRGAVTVTVIAVFIGGPWHYALHSHNPKALESVMLLSCFTVLHAGALGWYAATAFRRAWRERASDIALSSKGILVKGGRHDGHAFHWDDVDRASTGTKDSVRDRRRRASGRIDDEGEDLRQLWLVTRSGRRALLASATERRESEVLCTLAATIASPAWGGEAVADAVAAAEVTVLSCASCGAALAPEDVAEVTCAHCGSRAPVAEDLRARIRAPRDLSHAVVDRERIVRELLTFPAGVDISSALGLSAIPLALTFFGAVFYDAGVALVGLGLFFSVISWVCFRLADRHAIRNISVIWAARAPSRPGQPFQCRSCGAPLPSASDVVLACSFCSDSNVIGLDCRAAVRSAIDADDEVTRALSLRKRGRREQAMSIAFGALLAVFGVLIGVASR